MPPSQRPAPDLSVVIVTYNGRDQALATVESAMAHAGAGISIEWLVVDNGSTDGTPDAISSRWPAISVERGANVGFAAGNNVALARARGRYVLLLNPDVDVLQGILAELVDALDRRPEVGAASVIQRGPGGELLHSMRRFPSPGRQLGEALGLARLPGLRSLQERVTDPAEYRRERDADWLVGAFLVLRREALSAVGRLDERFFLYSEETDLCFRLRGAGWQMKHLPFMTVTHHQGGYASPELAAQLSYSKLLFARKHRRRPAAALFRSALIAGHGLRLALAVALAPFRPQLRSRALGDWRALRVLVGTGPPPFSREGGVAA
jgi:N-acetylglucosaminyl-diphospho-decaprenol L-rhamnosyltransferase